MTNEEVLQNCTVKGKVVKLPNFRLERDQYVAVKKALELIGGKWNRREEGFLFSSPPEGLLKQVASGVKRNLKKEFQFFATPEKYVRELIRLAKLKRGQKVLEPSAGQGIIVSALNELGITPDCYELMDVNRDIMANKHPKLEFRMLGPDFFENKGKLYDRIIANPPFTRNKDIKHLTEMYNLLAPGGRVVCITSDSWRVGSQKTQVAFREWLEELGAEIIPIPKGTFKASGTMVGGNTIILDKPL